MMTSSISGRANRVAPDGSLHAVAARGLLWGNRGPLLGPDGRPARHSQGRGWVCCLLDFHDRHRPQWRPGRLTELYFLDEATALAAGHRPCGECRHADHRRFKALWTGVFPEDRTASDLDRRLHDARPRTALPDRVSVRTPEPTVAVLRAGFVPGYHPSATPAR